MKKNNLILTLSIATTAIFSTFFAFLLFQYANTDTIAAEQDYAAKFVDFEYVNAKPLASDHILRELQEEVATLKAQQETLLNRPTSTILPDDFVATSRMVTPAIVNVGASSGAMRSANGSGVIISSDGYIITNFHVIEGTNRYNITLQDKREYRATLIGTDPTTDLALLKIEAEDLPTVKFGNSDNVEVGEWVLAVGNPFNLASTVTAGIISAKGRNINILADRYSIESFLQTDAVVNPGNSGGALVNATGKLVGINSAILSETGVFEGYSFAIPANLVKKVIEDLKDFGEVKRAILGVTIRDVDDNRANRLGLASVTGVVIQEVNPSSSAEVAGLKSGDVIVSVNGRNINSTPELQEQVARFRPGDRISVDYIRNGKRYTKENIRLKGLPQE